MSVTTPIFRLKVDSGDTGLVDKKGSAGALTGSATQTLIDRGSGEYAMRVAAGQLAVTLPSKTVTHDVTGGGISWAMDIAVENYGTLDYNTFINLGTAAAIAANSTSSTGIALARYGSGQLNFTKDDGTYSPAMTMGTGKHTIACRLTANISGGFWRFDVWIGGAGAAGRAPDYTSQLTQYANSTLSVLTFNMNNGTIIDIRDLAVWAEELSNADMAAVADGLRATVDAASSTNGTAAGATLTGTASISPGSASGTSAGGTNGTAAGATLTGTSSFTPGAASSVNGGTLTTNILKNNTGAVLANETGVTLNIYNASTGVLVLQATGLTTNASGIATTTNAAIVTGTSYAYEPVLSGGRRKLTVKAAV